MGLLDALKQYASDSLGGSLNPEVGNTLSGLLNYGKDRAKYIGGLLDESAPINQDLQNWHKRTQLGLADQLAGKETPAADYAYSQLMNMAGVAPVGMFAGVNAKTADLAKQGLAAKMLQAGDDPAKVWSQTGWGIGPDGKWRFEIPDNAAQLESGGKYFGLNGGGGNVSQVLDHPSLMQAYPEVGDISTSFRFGDRVPHHSGSFDDSARHINVDAPLGFGSAKSTTLHELQHAIQRNENFSRGGNPNQFFNHPAVSQSISDATRPIDSRSTEILNEIGRLQNGPRYKGRAKDVNKLADEFYSLGARRNSAIQDAGGKASMDMYKSLGGEAESRLTQHRMNLDATQRAAQYPWEPDYFQGATGVKLGDLINRFE